MSSRCSIFFQDGWHFWFDVTDYEIIFRATDDRQIKVSIDEAKKLIEGLERAIDYCAPDIRQVLKMKEGETCPLCQSQNTKKNRRER